MDKIFPRILPLHKKIAPGGTGAIPGNKISLMQQSKQCQI